MPTNKMSNTNSTFNVTFGIKGYDAIPANAAVLVNECTKWIGGEKKKVTEFLAVSGVKSTKQTDLLMPVLAVMLADARRRGGFASDFKVVAIGSTTVETKLTAKSAYTKWLKGNCVYKSNSEGALTRALVLDEGVLLRNTALKVSEKHGLYASKGDTQRVLMHKTCEAIVAQATMFSGIVSDAKAIFNDAYATPAVKKPTTKAKSKKKSA